MSNAKELNCFCNIIHHLLITACYRLMQKAREHSITCFSWYDAGTEYSTRLWVSIPMNSKFFSAPVVFVFMVIVTIN